MTSPYRRLAEKPFDSHYLLAEIEIDRPPAQVWPVALDIDTWMDAHRLETIDGEPGTVGHFARVHPRGLADDVPLPHHHLYGIAHLIPERYIALEVINERGGSYGKTREKISFDGILLVEAAGRTKVLFLFVDARLGASTPSEHDARTEELVGVRAMLDGYLDHLKRLVEMHPR